MAAGYAFKRNQLYDRDNGFYRRCVGWQLKFVWRPNPCYLTGRRLWLECACRGTRLLTGDTIMNHRWQR